MFKEFCATFKLILENVRQSLLNRVKNGEPIIKLQIAVTKTFCLCKRHVNRGTVNKNNVVSCVFFITFMLISLYPA